MPSKKKKRKPPTYPKRKYQSGTPEEYQYQRDRKELLKDSKKKVKQIKRGSK